MEYSINVVYAVIVVGIVGLIIGVVSGKVKFSSPWFRFGTDNTHRDNKAESKGRANKINQGTPGQSSRNRARIEGDDNEISQY